MADLSERDRGQILLVAAFALAVTFVALALVINSSIFTENLATRGEISGSGDAIESRHEVEQSVGEVVRYANEHNHSDATSLEDTVAHSLGNVSAQVGQQKLRFNDFVNVTTVGSTGGTRIFQNDTSSLENDGGTSGDWRLTGSGVTQTRDLQLNLTSFPNSESDAFNVTANETTTTAPAWNMSIWEDGGDVQIQVDTANGDVATCTRSGIDPLNVHVNEGLVDGQPCHALLRSGTGGTEMGFGTGVSSPYHLVFTNGDQVTGNYSMVVQGGSSSSGVPNDTPALYSVRVDYVFQNARIHYGTEVRVAPGESP